MKRRILGLGGGSTKGYGTLAICYELAKKGIIFDTIIGTSIGAILSIIVAMRLYKQVFEIFAKLTLDDIFGAKPINDNGDFRFAAAFHLLKHKYALGNMDSLNLLLRKIITKEIFEQYISGSNYAVCWAASVDIKTGRRVFKNLKECEYEEAITHIMASASIPVFTMPVFDGEYMLFDGGLRDHVANAEFINGTYDECYTIFTREKEPSLQAAEPKNIIEILMRTIEIMNIEISKNDEEKIDSRCEKHGIANYKFYLPKILTSLYDTDPTRLNKLYIAGRQIGADFKYI